MTAENPTRLRVKSWRDYQHYTDRSPPWIKLHVKLLSSRMWVMCSDSERMLAVASMLLASMDDAGDGSFCADPEYVKRVCYLKRAPDFKPLIDNDFLEHASGCKRMLADARPEKRQRRDREDTETEGARAKPSKSTSRKPKSTPVPDPFPITDPMREWADAAGLPNGPWLKNETDKFLDHHASKGNQFADWTRAWQKWCRQAVDYEGASKQGRSGGSDDKGKSLTIGQLWAWSKSGGSKHIMRLAQNLNVSTYGKSNEILFRDIIAADTKRASAGDNGEWLFGGNDASK